MIIRRNLKLGIILRASWLQLFYFALVAGGAGALHELLGMTHVRVPGSAVSALGAALAIFLAFRNNSSYGRWWEARKLWGRLINASRTFARQVTTFVEPQPPEEAAKAPAQRIERARALQKRLMLNQAAYAHALRLHLRGQPIDDEPEVIENLAEEDRSALALQSNRPFAIIRRQGEILQQLRRERLIDDFRHIQIDFTLSEMLAVQGGCERIKKTPLPRQYDYFPRVFVYVYAALLPFALVGQLGWATAAVSVPVSFLFYALDTIGRLNEDPFETRIQDVPLAAMSRTIEIDLKQAAGSAQIPEPLQPVDGFLM